MMKWRLISYILGQLKDRLRRLEQFGDMAVHPSEQPRRNHLAFIVLDIGGMEFIDAR